MPPMQTILTALTAIAMRLLGIGGQKIREGVFWMIDQKI
jgi:hypothetical protein